MQPLKSVFYDIHILSAQYWIIFLLYKIRRKTFRGLNDMSYPINKTHSSLYIKTVFKLDLKQYDEITPKSPINLNFGMHDGWCIFFLDMFVCSVHVWVVREQVKYIRNRKRKHTQNALQKICRQVIRLQQLQAAEIPATLCQEQSTEIVFDEAPRIVY